MTQTQKARVAFVDDEKDLADSLGAKYSNDYETTAFTSPEKALSEIDESYAVVVADHRMPGITGVDLLTRLRIKTPDTVRILLTAVPDLISLAAVINEAKVFHYVLKEPRFPEHMKGVLDEAIELYSLRQANKRNLAVLTQHNSLLEAKLRARTAKAPSFEDLLGNDPQLQEAIRKGKQAANRDRPVLITGESGTGKDVLAQAIHYESNRKTGPFKLVNCSQFRPELAQAALFGKVKGAYTGAEPDKGILRRTHGGTLFLNEIGELLPDVQAFLLTFLDHGDIDPVGYSGTERITADVRLIAATNRDIIPDSHATAGKFRLDLFNRINGIPIRLPALHDRPADIPILARHAITMAAAELGLDGLSISDEAVSYLQSLPWPGNVRELINTMEQTIDLVEMNGASTVELKHVREVTCQQHRAITQIPSLDEAVDAFAKRFIEAALKRHNYKLEATAAELGRSVKSLFDLRKKLGIAREA